MGKLIFLNRVGGGEMTKANEKISICKKAEEVRHDYGITDFPVEPTLIAKELKIEIKEVGFKKHDGYVVSGGIIKDNSNFIIYVNNQDSMNRKRFTIAHELGHYFLNHLDNKGQYVDLHREATYIKSQEEIEADEFAACLLMPETLIKEKFNILSILKFDKDTIVDKLANSFFVSQSAMKYRLVNLNLIKL